MSYWIVGSSIVNSLYQADRANSAAARGRKVQREQMQQAELMQEKEIAETARLQEKQLAAQSRAQAASLAQARNAAAESQAMMDKQLKAADEATNRANQKRPNTAKILDEAQQAGRAGASGTMLTGPQGVDLSTLKLGKNTLLGE